MQPASIRNNNPGAMEPGPSSKKFGSTSFETLRWTYKGKPATNRIATFPTPVHGAAAMFDLLYSRYTGSTVAKAIEKWCGGYYAGEYAKSLEQKCGVTGDTTLTKDRVRDADTAILLAKGMARVEAGQNFPLTDAEWKQAHDMAFADAAAAPEWTPDNDVPTPGIGSRRAIVLKDAAVKGVGGVLASGGAYVAQNGIPPPPAVATSSLDSLGAWKGLVGSITALGALPLSILAGAAALGALHYVPKWIKGDA